MIKTKILIAVCLISFSTIPSCSLHEERTDVFISNDPWLEIVIPTTFEYENEFYRINYDKEERDKEKIGDFQGYWVNKKDLEKWKRLDNDEKIKYIVDDVDNLLNLAEETDPVDMTNRFRFYKEKNGISLYVYVDGGFHYYENQGEIMNNEINGIIKTSFYSINNF